MDQRELKIGWVDDEANGGGSRSDGLASLYQLVDLTSKAAAAADGHAIAERGLKHCLAELCWENDDGWSDPCKLIGRAPPDRQFPHRNRRPDLLPGA